MKQAPSGAIYITISEGGTLVGAQAPDGSMYVTVRDGSTFVGKQAKDGSLNVQLSSGSAAPVANGQEVTIDTTTYTFTVEDGVITNIVSA